MRALKGKPPKSYRRRIGPQARKGHKASNAPTFAQAVEDATAALSSGWKNAETSARAWRQTPAKHAYPHLGQLSIADIRGKDVPAAIESLWSVQNPTAKELLQHICKVLDRVKTQGHRSSKIAAKEVTAALPTNGH